MKSEEWHCVVGPEDPPELESMSRAIDHVDVSRVENIRVNTEDKNMALSDKNSQQVRADRIGDDDCSSPASSADILVFIGDAADEELRTVEQRFFVLCYGELRITTGVKSVHTTSKITATVVYLALICRWRPQEYPRKPRDCRGVL